MRQWLLSVFGALLGISVTGVAEVESGSLLILEVTDGRRIPEEAIARIQVRLGEKGLHAVVLQDVRLRAWIAPERLRIVMEHER